MTSNQNMKIVGIFLVTLLLTLPFHTASVFAETTDTVIITGEPAATETSSPEPQTQSALSLSVSMPEYANSFQFGFSGNAGAESMVDVYVNGNLARTVLSDESGAFTFSRVLLTPNVDNIVRVRAETLDKSAVGEQTYTVKVDDISPQFLSFSEIPSVIAANSFDISGTASEPVTLLVGSGEESSYQEVAQNVTNFNYTLSLQEGAQQVDIVIRDAAGNTDRKTQQVFVDTAPPVILEHNLADLTPTYSREITVRGKVSEQSTVTIVIDGKCSYQQDVVRTEPFDSETGGSFGCLNYDSSDSLTQNVYTTETDEEGYFSKRVTIRPTFGTQLREIERPSVSASSTGMQITAKTSGFDNNIQIFATDSSGLVGEASDIVTYATCASADGDFLVFQQEVFPGALIPDHIFQGIAMISFQIELNYIGSEEVSDIDLRIGSIRELSTQDQGKFDVDLLEPSRCQSFPDSTGKKWYVNCPLKRYPPDVYRNITAAYDELEKKQSVTLPINLEIYYSTRKINSQGQQQETQKAQVVCYDLEFGLDQRIDPSDIPRKLLNETIEVLDDAIEAIDTILPYVNRAKWASAIGCLGMYVWNFVSKTKEAYACFMIEDPDKKEMIRELRGTSDSTVPQEILSKFVEEYEDREGDPQACADWLSRSRKAEISRQWVCDRIFCPAVPSAQKHAKDNYENDESPCNNYQLQASNIFPGSTDKCIVEYQKNWQSACPGLRAVKKSQELIPGYEPDSDPTAVDRFLNFLDGFSLCTFGQEDPQRAVAYDRAGQPSIIENRAEDGTISYNIGRRTDKTELNPDDLTLSDETGLSKYYTRDNFAIRNSETTFTEQTSPFGKTPEVSKTQDCVFVKPDSTSYTKAESAAIEQVKVGEKTDGRMLWSVTGGSKFNSAYKTGRCASAAEFLVDVNGVVYCKTESGVVQAPTYYVKQNSPSEVEAFQHDGDAPPSDCMRSDIIGESAAEEILTVPSDGFINSIRCACFPAIEGYLQAIRSILNAIRNCFKSVLVTGEFDTGVCRAVLTQYLCSFVFDLLGCFTKSFAVGATAGDRDSPVGGFMAAIRSAGEDIRKSSERRYGTTETFRALFNERQLLHSLCLMAFGYDWQPDLEAALSVGGGDFAIETMGLVAPATRQFISYNPNNEGATTHVYHVGYFLVAGHDLQWQLELICSATDTCKPEDGFDMGRCDCSGRFPPTVTQSPYGQPGVNPFITQQAFVADPSVGFAYSIDGGQLTGGETVGGGSGNPYDVPIGTRGTGEVYVSLEHPYRYDRVRLSWTPRSGVEGKSGEIIVPIRQSGMGPPGFCSFSLALGKFSCNLASPADGFIYLNGISEVRGNQVVESNIRAYTHDEDIEFEVSYTYQPPESGREIIPRFLRIQIFDENEQLLRGSQYTTGYQEIEASRGTIRVPQLARSARELLGQSSERVSAAGTATPLQMEVDGTSVKELPVEIRSSDVSLNKRGTENRWMIFLYDGSTKTFKVSYNLVGQAATGTAVNTPDQLLRTHVQGTQLLPFISTTISATTDVVRIDLSESFPSSGLQGVIDIDRTACKDAGLCASAIQLKGQTTSLTLAQRCTQNGEKPLIWTARFTLMDGDVGATSAVRVTPSFGTGGRETEKTVEFTIGCSVDSEVQSTNFCAIDLELTSSNLNCVCGSQTLTQTIIDSGNKYCVPTPVANSPDWKFTQDMPQEQYQLSLETSLRVCPNGVFLEDDEHFYSRSAVGTCKVVFTDIPASTTCVSGQYFDTEQKICRPPKSLNKYR